MYLGKYCDSFRIKRGDGAYNLKQAFFFPVFSLHLPCPRSIRSKLAAFRECDLVLVFYDCRNLILSYSYYFLHPCKYPNNFM